MGLKQVTRWSWTGRLPRLTARPSELAFPEQKRLAARGSLRLPAVTAAPVPAPWRPDPAPRRAQPSLPGCPHCQRRPRTLVVRRACDAGVVTQGARARGCGSSRGGARDRRGNAVLGTGLPGSSSGTCHVLWLGYSQPCSLLGSPVLLMRGTGFGVSTAPLCTKSTYGGGGGGGGAIHSTCHTQTVVNCCLRPQSDP